MDVPDMSSYESPLAAKMLTPGAAMSGCHPNTNREAKDAIISFRTKIVNASPNQEKVYTHITLSIPGNCALGPLEENVATLGEATCAPTTVAAGDILATTLAKVTQTGTQGRVS